MNDQNPPSTSPFQSIRTIDYTVILVRDMAAMRRFYEGVLRFSADARAVGGMDRISDRRQHARAVAAGPDGEGCADAHGQRVAAARVQGCALMTSIAARTSWCGTASICWSRRRTSRSAIARCSSGIPMETCWRCMRRFDAG